MHCTIHLSWDLHCEKTWAVPTPCQGHTTGGEQLAPKATFFSANGTVADSGSTQLSPGKA